LKVYAKNKGVITWRKESRDSYCSSSLVWILFWFL